MGLLLSENSFSFSYSEFTLNNENSKPQDIYKDNLRVQVYKLTKRFQN
ncbi:hypothetical protein LEP1GSC188_1985 [Leptospira weilii serovar Topaz str. LT2116]|uniref:Uncharacterized protein n=1 Tax=Leptospira weilii serovar Topaz str. LT2116 TaxID=1088540 RepID=M3H2G5_9LEPT|nr:hypothetical protein LEP1GSC188_1985 [Leptospira weilii serovar Topaz str. LT2116]